MRSISRWAKHHVAAARFIIFFIHISLIILATYVGTHVPRMPVKVFYASALSAIMAATVYSLRSKKRLLNRDSFVFRKTCEFIVATGLFFVTCFFVNHNLHFPSFQSRAYAFAIRNTPPGDTGAATQLVESLKYRDKNTLTKHEKRVLKKEFKTQLRAYAKAHRAHNKDGESHAAEIIVTIVVALGLLFLLTILACSISCAGAEALGYLVLILGAVVITFFTVKVIKGFNKKRKEKEPEGNLQGESRSVTDQNLSFIRVLP